MKSSESYPFCERKQFWQKQNKTNTVDYLIRLHILFLHNVIVASKFCHLFLSFGFFFFFLTKFTLDLFLFASLFTVPFLAFRTQIHICFLHLN